MVKIRLSLKGRKGQRSFWIIAIDEREPRDSGNYLEYLGFYNPQSKEIKLEKEKINKWLACGAQPTDTVQNLLKKHF
ncbi:MAG: 30S ribosomal protein S16 [Mycoplasmataceae bacterium]|nr:MAG: 30S ribosomal protein S16 [Mycoplasmataceae bacterium]